MNALDPLAAQAILFVAIRSLMRYIQADTPDYCPHAAHAFATLVTRYEQLGGSRREFMPDYL